MVHLSRIYTKTGDDGTTGLGDGSRTSKTDLRVEAYGTVDETNAVLGLAVGALPDGDMRTLLRGLQNTLFDVGADLASPWVADEAAGTKLRITAAQATALEPVIDQWNARLQPLRSFVLPGGSPAAQWLHLARTVCRRAERCVVAAGERKIPVNPAVLVWLNRLSDLLFVLARVANDDGKADVLWEPGKPQAGLADRAALKLPETRRDLRRPNG